MTPTNDAPVTVEQCVMACPQCEGEGGYADGLDDAACHTDCTRCGGNGWIVDLAALASAPAGDGKAIGPAPAKVLGEGNALMEARIRFRSNFPPPYNTASHISFRYNEGTWCADNLLNDLRETQEANGCLCDFVTVDVLEIDGAALPRPRAAVGEADAKEIGRIVRWIDQVIERARKHGSTEGLWLFASQWQTVRAILALQSPPAKE